MRFVAKVVLEGEEQDIRVDAVSLKQAEFIAEQLYGDHLVSVSPHIDGDES